MYGVNAVGLWAAVSSKVRAGLMVARKENDTFVLMQVRINMRRASEVNTGKENPCSSQKD
jgi:hypothetical protein